MNGHGGMKGKQENKMNKKLIFTMATSLVLIACGGQKEFTPEGCEIIDIPACVNQAFITINTKSHKVAPPHICPDPVQDIEVRVVPRNGEVGSVVTSPKKLNDPDHDWLNGTNDPDADNFTLSPPDGTPEGYYDYKVTFADGYCIDPRISL